MALTASLALSGLTRDTLAGSDLQILYDHAERILNSASCSSLASSASSYDSGISSSASESVETGLKLIRFLQGLDEVQLSLPNPSPVDIQTTTSPEQTVRKPEEGAVNSLVGTIKILEVGLTKALVEVEEGDKPAEVATWDKNVEIMYQGRDILNLGENIKGGWELRAAVLYPGIENFFQNRSQLSRVDGVCAPRHTLTKCNDEDCDFIEPHYY